MDLVPKEVTVVAVAPALALLPQAALKMAADGFDALYDEAGQRWITPEGQVLGCDRVSPAKPDDLLESAGVRQVLTWMAEYRVFLATDTDESLADAYLELGD